MPGGGVDWALGALSAARVVFYSVDCASGHMMRSGNCSAILGVPSAGPIPLWQDIILPGDRARYEEARDGLSHATPHFEVAYRVRNADTGQQIWVLDRGSADFDGDGRITSIHGAIIDVSVRMGIEGDLRKAVRLGSVVFRAARMAAWHFDLATQRFSCTDELLAILNIERGEFDGTPGALENAIHPGDRAAWRDAHEAARASGRQMDVEFRVPVPGSTARWILSQGETELGPDGSPLESSGVMIDITERKNWEKHQATLLRELSHRVKNTLAVVQSVARQTLRSSPDARSFVDAFEGRIRSLAASCSLLTDADWSGAKMETIIHHQVTATVQDSEGRFTLRGPLVVLSAEMATQIGLVLHELATNAAQHGALSVPGGSIDILWSVTRTKLRLLWREHGGPPVGTKPEFSGFGTRLIKSSATKASQRFASDGLVCKLEFAL